jgi:hypothetical protein
MVLNFAGRWIVIVIASFTTSCATSMVAVVNVDDVHIIRKSLTEEQVKAAIIEGAETAGWHTKDLGNGHLLATYHVRTHTVHVNIDYINSNYSTRYDSSNGMKIFCTERDKKNHMLKVTGRDTCPGGYVAYIHASYKEWIDSLNAGIQNSLGAM